MTNFIFHWDRYFIIRKTVIDFSVQESSPYINKLPGKFRKRSNCVRAHQKTLPRPLPLYSAFFPSDLNEIREFLRHMRSESELLKENQSNDSRGRFYSGAAKPAMEHPPENRGEQSQQKQQFHFSRLPSVQIHKSTGFFTIVQSFHIVPCPQIICMGTCQGKLLCILLFNPGMSID